MQNFVKFNFFITFVLLGDIIGPLFGWDCSKIVQRKEWNSMRGGQVEYMIIPVKYAIIEHTATAECLTFEECKSRVKSIQDYCVNNLDYDDIGYTFLVGSDGNVYEGVGWHKVGAHTYGYNRNSLGIAFIGDFSDKLPPEASLQAVKELLKCSVEKGELAEDYKLYGHRQLVALESPGLRLYRLIKGWPHWTAQAPKN